MYYPVGLFALLIALKFGAEACTDPKMSVIGGVYIDKEKTHYVRDGYSVEVFCSSDFPNRLEIFNFNKLYSEIINSTTIRTVIKVSRDNHGFLECRNTCPSDSQSDYTAVQVEYYPKIADFNCYCENFELLHCTWSAPNDKGNYSLSYIQQDGTILLQICRKTIWYDRSFTCVFDLSNLEDTDPDNPHVNLKLEICNYFGCVNQTYDVDLLEITKLAAPTDLRMRYFTDAYDETVLFFHWKPFRNELVSEMEVYFVVEYWFHGIEPRVLISETKLCYRRIESNHIVNLPCPDKQFNLRVSCRPAKAPPKYMSDYAYISFHTDSDPAAKVDPICKIRPVVETPPVMVYKTQLLGKYLDEEIEKFNKLKKSLADKAAVIRKLQNN